MSKGEPGLNIKAYLERINYCGSLAPTAETLRALQVAHLLTVPFENLSIHASEAIVLDDDSLFTKIVERRRGGFCYELNGLFAALLQALGFEVIMLSARVANAEGGFGPDFDHMALMVKLDQRWLADVGFGDSFREPLLLDVDDDQLQGAEAFRVVHDQGHWTVLRRGEHHKWQVQYRFTLQPYHYADYSERCLFQQTSPESHFTKGRMCSRATADGRITISEMRFITTTLSGERKEREMTSEAEYASILEKHFGIVMTR